MSKTSILQLNLFDVDHDLRSYSDRLQLEVDMTSNASAVDAFAGAVSASLHTKFFFSGSASTALQADLGADYAPFPRVIREVVAFAAGTGSSGVTTIDLKMQDSGGVFNSIFGVSNTNRPSLSASVLSYATSKKTSFITSSWAPGTILKASLASAVAAGQEGLTVLVFWKPSGSYGV